MIEISNNNTERAILVALNTKYINREIVEEHLSELEELAMTAGADTIIKLIQDRYAMDPAFYIGKGKAEELAQLTELNNIDLVIFDDDLSLVQVRNLEKLVNKKIIDTNQNPGDRMTALVSYYNLSDWPAIKVKQSMSEIRIIALPVMCFSWVLPITIFNVKRR